MSTPGRVRSSISAHALVALALTVACAPAATLDRGEPIDGRGDFMRAGGRTGTGTGGSNGGPGAGTGGTGGARSTEVDAGLPAVRDAKPPPPLRDAVAASCNDLPSWQPGFEYEPGAGVVHGTPRRRFECRPWPNSGWCSNAQYEPASPKGHWPDAWIDDGVCP